jgi:2-methylaconitate cis-trans-isomerase PrpF
MHPEMEMLRCAIMRGGTSKGVFRTARRIMEGYVYVRKSVLK